MFSKRAQHFIGKVTLFLVVFASLAPSVSHALAAQSKDASFLQEVCSSDGSKKIIIQTITTHGQQISTIFDAKTTQESAPQSIGHHFEHCPFCSAGAANLAITPPSSAWVLMLAQQAESIDFDYVTPFQPFYLQTAHPSRAPPALT